MLMDDIVNEVEGFKEHDESGLPPNAHATEKIDFLNEHDQSEVLT